MVESISARVCSGSFPLSPHVCTAGQPWRSDHLDCGGRHGNQPVSSQVSRDGKKARTRSGEEKERKRPRDERHACKRDWSEVFICLDSVSSMLIAP